MAKRIIETYTDTAGEHRWRVRSGHNGKILHVSSESYTRRGDAEEAAERENLGGHTYELRTEDRYYNRVEHLDRAKANPIVGRATPKAKSA